MQAPSELVSGLRWSRNSRFRLFDPFPRVRFWPRGGARKMLLSAPPDFSFDLLSPCSKPSGSSFHLLDKVNACCRWLLATGFQFGKKEIQPQKTSAGQLWTWDYELGVGNIRKLLFILLHVVMTMWICKYSGVFRTMKPAIYIGAVH